MSDLKLVSFEANEDGVYPLSFAARQSEVRIFTGGCEGNELSGSDFVVEPDGRGGDQVRITKAHEGTIWIACVPDTAFQINKFGVQMLPDLNDWFGRLAARLAFMEHRLDGAVGADPGCDGHAIISEIDEAIAGLNDDLEAVGKSLEGYLPRPYRGATLSVGADGTVLAWVNNRLQNRSFEAMLDNILDERLLARKRELYPGDTLEDAARRAVSVSQSGADFVIDRCAPPIRIIQDCEAFGPLCDMTLNFVGPDDFKITDPCNERIVAQGVHFNPGDWIDGCADAPVIAGFRANCDGDCVPKFRCPTTIEQR